MKKILEKKLYIILQYKVIIYSHTPRGSATIFIKKNQLGMTEITWTRTSSFVVLNFGHITNMFAKFI